MRHLQVLYTVYPSKSSKSLLLELDEDTAYEFENYVHPDGFFEWLWDHVPERLAQVEGVCLDHIELDDAFLVK